MNSTSLFYLLLLLSALAFTQNANASVEYALNLWSKKIDNTLSKPPPMLLSQASPMTADAAIIFARLMEDGRIADHLLPFCKEAKLACSLHSLSDTYFDKINYAGSNYVDSAIDFHLDFGKKLGIFFRESALKSENVIPMPNITNKMPKRSFLPHIISSKLPFSIPKLPQLNHIFHAKENSLMGKILAHTVAQCERPAIDGEMKSCVSSIEDMIDFATMILGNDVMVLYTNSAEGSKQQVMVGEVKRTESNNMRKSVVCHQILFPSVIYYCHSFLDSQIYEVNILDRNSKVQINRAVAVCHFNTSAWNPNHPAFLDLKSSPGLTEACHWIYENNMLWIAI